MAGLMATGQKTCRDSAAAVRRMLCVAGVLTLAVAILLVSLPQVASADMATALNGSFRYLHDRPTSVTGRHRSPERDLPPPRA